MPRRPTTTPAPACWALDPIKGPCTRPIRPADLALRLVDRAAAALPPIRLCAWHRATGTDLQLRDPATAPIRKAATTTTAAALIPQSLVGARPPPRALRRHATPKPRRR